MSNTNLLHKCEVERMKDKRRRGQSFISCVRMSNPGGFANPSQGGAPGGAYPAQQGTVGAPGGMGFVSPAGGAGGTAPQQQYGRKVSNNDKVHCI